MTSVNVYITNCQLSKTCFMTTVEEDDIVGIGGQETLISKPVLVDLCNEAAKLKALGGMNKVRKTKAVLARDHHSWFAFVYHMSQGADLLQPVNICSFLSGAI